MIAVQTLPPTDTITPADQAAVAEAVRTAADSDTAVYPRGGGTMVDSGRPGIVPSPFGRGVGGEGVGDEMAKHGEVSGQYCPHPSPLPKGEGTHALKPVRPGITLSLAKLNRVIDYPAADMTITVEAGMTIAELNRQLAAGRQWLPVDVPWPDRATVGGAIAVNAAGPRRYAYGTMRDYLLGFTAVDGTGMTFSGGGRVVKNAAGYNMCRLMAGSWGTLGVITQATLMVRPLPEASALLACEVGNFDLTEKLLAGLVRSPVRPVAVELAAGRSHEGNPLFGPLLESNVCRLYVGFEGSAAEVKWMLSTLHQEWAALGMTSPVLMPSLATDKLWRWISELPADVRMSVLPSKLIDTIVSVLKAAPDCAVHAHAGDGVIRVARVGVAHERGLGTSVPSEHGTDAGDAPLSGINVMRAIKDRFDPKNILNPGRFVFDR